MARVGRTGKGGNAQDGTLVVQTGRRKKGEASAPQLRRPRGRSWTVRRRARFLEVLKATSNVSEAVRQVGLTASGAYDLRRRDAAFAAEWTAALEQGYAELEMLLLRQSMFGSDTTETVDDGKGDGARRVKTVHSYPHAMALRLLLAHKSEVDAYRDRQGIGRPGEDMIRDEIQRRIAETRARLRMPDDADTADGGGNGA